MGHVCHNPARALRYPNYSIIFVEEFPGTLLVCLCLVDGQYTCEIRRRFPTSHDRNLIKGQLTSPAFPSIPLNKAKLHDHNSLFIMLFYKSLVSFVAAIALAGTVTASVTPVRRTTSSTSSTSICISGQQKRCCNSFGSINDPQFSQFGGFLSLFGNINPTTQLGIGCAVLTNTWYHIHRFCYFR